MPPYDAYHNMRYTSVMQTRLLIIALISLITFVAAIFIFVYRGSRPIEYRNLRLRDMTIRAEIAQTIPEKIRGLSGREKLDADEGMLFMYDKPGTHAFWMKDMRFSIDIIWFDSDWHVVDLTIGASPESFPQRYTSRSPAQYILEVPAGFAEAHGILIGDEADVR